MKRAKSSHAAEELRAADAAWLKAYRSKDAKRAAGFYDEHGSMLAPNTPRLSGKKALEKFIAKSFAMPEYEISWRCHKAEVARSGELGYTRGSYRMSFRDASGNKFSDSGKYLMLWRKRRDGTWKVLLDMSNSDLPARGRYNAKVGSRAGRSPRPSC